MTKSVIEVVRGESGSFAEDSLAQGSFYDSEFKQVEIYKRHLLRTSFAVGIIIVLLVTERILYELIISQELTALHSIQTGLGLISQQSITADNVTIEQWVFSDSFMWTFLGTIDEFKFNFLIVTAIVGILYTSVDSLVAVKVGFATLYGYNVISCVTLLYSDSLPFWESDDIAAPVCLKTFSHPSRTTFIYLFLVSYTAYMMKRRITNNDNSDEEAKETSPSSLFSRITWAVISIVIASIIFTKYLMGLDFMFGILLGTLYFVIFFALLVFFNKYVDRLLQQTTIQESSAKKFVFYWFIYLIISETFSTVLYSSQNQYLPPDWITNYIQCAQVTNSIQNNASYEEILGPWFTFIQTSATFGLIGAIFGAAYTYRGIAKKNFAWSSSGGMQQRLLRSLVLLVSLVPSTIFTMYQMKIVNSSWIREVGFNEFYISCFHYFFLYLYLYAMLPEVCKKLGLVQDQVDDEGYNVLQTQQNLSTVSADILSSNPNLEMQNDQHAKKNEHNH